MITLFLAGVLLVARGEATSTHATPSSPSEPLLETYTDPEYGFTFDYPRDAQVYAFDDEPGYTVLITNPETKQEFQLYITPFDELEPLTFERIRLDLPSMAVEDVATLDLPGLDTSAVTFTSTDNALGRFYEAWFVHAGHLYQSTTFDATSETLIAALTSLRVGDTAAPGQ